MNFAEIEKMQEQFKRTELIFGAENMERLQKARVAVFGVGGVGGYTVEALARSGIGTLDLRWMWQRSVFWISIQRQMSIVIRFFICQRQQGSLILLSMTMWWMPLIP